MRALKIALSMALILLTSAQAAFAGDISSYCRRVESDLRKNWKQSDLFSNVVLADFDLDSGGKIVNVNVTRGGKSSGAEKAAVISLLNSVYTPDPVPQTADSNPLKLTIALSNETGKISAYSRDVNWGPYMADLQRRIKRA